MKFMPLNSAQDLLEAKKLLYQSYVEALDWSPSPNNPSGFRIEKVNQYHILTDNFDHQSLWFGVFDEQKVLLACVRLLKSTNAKLEFSLYTKPPEKMTSDFTNWAEMNRVAIRPGYENSLALPFLMNELIQFAQKHGFSNLLTTVSFPNPGDFLVHLGWMRWPNTEFKYAQNETRSVEILTLDLKDVLKMERIKNTFDNLMAS